MNRKITAFLLSLIMLLSLTGCRSGDYKKATALAENGSWQEAREIFGSLEDYKDAADKITECDYHIALEKKDAGDYDAALTILLSLGDYADSAAQSVECRYLKATSLFKAGKWEDAAEAFDALGDYKDSASQSLECRYLKAKSLLEAGEWNAAAEAFEVLGAYKDSADMVFECSYRKAEKLLSDENYDQASEIFEKLGDYRDSKDRYMLCRYQKGMQLYENGDYETAFPVFRETEGYKDSDYYAVLSILQYDPKTFVDSFAHTMSEMFEAGNLPMTMTESVANYQRDARHFVLDRGPRSEVSMSFEPSYSDGSVTSRGQISTIHITGDTESIAEMENTLMETLVASVLTMAALDSTASPEDLANTFGEAYAEMLLKFPDIIPETGHFERIEIPYEHYQCIAAISFWPNYYRFLFMITTPELVMQK